MTDNVITLPVITTLDIPVERVLDGAKSELNHEMIVLVAGFDKDGKIYLASNKSDRGGALLLLEAAKKAALDGWLEDVT